MSFSHQDWTPVILSKHTKPNNSNKTKIVKQNVNTQSDGIKVKKVWDPKDPTNEPDIRPVMIAREFGQQIQQARIAKGMTQKQLANAISIPVSIINDYEQCKGVHNSSHISKIKKYLGINKHSV
jgi:ribosome-binding protein aMBF1 (putative translation factor)